MVKNYEYREIGQRIKELRGGSRQRDWAEKIGCDQGYISQVENGVTKPSLAFLKGVASITKANIDWILTGRGIPTKEEAGQGWEAGASHAGMVEQYTGGLKADPEVKAGIERLLGMGAAGRALLKSIGGMDSYRVECLAALLGRNKR